MWVLQGDDYDCDTCNSKVTISLPGCWALCSLWWISTHLLLQTCEKQRLKKISKSDESALSFVFYMKADGSKQRKFESVLHRGWFIQIVNTDLVEMGTVDGTTEAEQFLFIIQKWWRATFFWWSPSSQSSQFNIQYSLVNFIWDLKMILNKRKTWGALLVWTTWSSNRHPYVSNSAIAEVRRYVSYNYIK